MIGKKKKKGGRGKVGWKERCRGEKWNEKIQKRNETKYEE